jgi:hypothetical protein
VDAGPDLPNPLAQGLLALVHPGGILLCTREFVVFLAMLHVRGDRHEVPQVVREQIEPLFEPALVEKVHFEEEKLLDVVVQRRRNRSFTHPPARAEAPGSGRA